MPALEFSDKFLYLVSQRTECFNGKQEDCMKEEFYEQSGVEQALSFYS